MTCPCGRPKGCRAVVCASCRDARRDHAAEYRRRCAKPIRVMDFSAAVIEARYQRAVYARRTGQAG